MATFSTNAEDAFTRTVDVHSRLKIKDGDLDDYFDIEKCLNFIKRGSFEKVALQFPDDLLSYSFKVVKLLEDKFPNTKLYVLGDTSYGSCCVDEVAAEHINADCVIHFGRSCLSMTKRLPVLFVFGKGIIDVEQFCQNLLNTFENREDKILILFDVVYHHVMEEIEDQLRKLYSSLIISTLVTEEEKECSSCLTKSNIEEKSHSSCYRTGKCCVKMPCVSVIDPYRKCSCPEYGSDKGGTIHERFGRRFELPSGTNVEDCTILYVGKESLTLVNLMISYNRNKFFTYDPERNSIQQETMNMNKTLMKRYYLIQKAKEAKTIGIVVGTLGVADYLLVIDHLKNIIKNAGKKYYTFMMGKPNIAKMANFMEIDIFVIVACPENSLIDSQEFYKPIITPFELAIACSRERSWTGEYITDFREILDDESEFKGVVKNSDMIDNDEPEYSLITGNLIQNLDMNDKGSNNDASLHLVPRSQENSLANFGENSSASLLQARFWKGLEQNLGQTEVVDVVEGRTGISIGYTHELDKIFDPENNESSRD